MGDAEVVTGFKKYLVNEFCNIGDTEVHEFYFLYKYKAILLIEHINAFWKLV